MQIEYCYLGKDGKMIIILSDIKTEQMGKKLYEYYIQKGIQVEFIAVSGLDIKPCYGCNGCTDKTYQQCVVRDDYDKILPAIINGEIIVYTSQLYWGGFSADIKKVIDKMSLTGDRFYHVSNQELVKGTVGKIKKIVGIAVSKVSSTEQEKSDFKGYIKEVGTIIDILYLAKIIEGEMNGKEIERLAMEVIEG